MRPKHTKARLLTVYDHVLTSVNSQRPLPLESDSEPDEKEHRQQRRKPRKANKYTGKGKGKAGKTYDSKAKTLTPAGDNRKRQVIPEAQAYTAYNYTTDR